MVFISGEIISISEEISGEITHLMFICCHTKYTLNHYA
jgi:hypothetical protein